MHISMWQQFSSNHSADYTVVGEFPSPQAAQVAAETIRKILEEAISWCFSHYDDCVASMTITPVEQHYAQVYNFDWKERIDWLTYGVKDAVTAVDRLVVIDPAHADTWQTGHQFADLLAAMQANVARDVMEGQEPGLDARVWMSTSIDVSAEFSPEQAALVQSELTQYIEMTKERRASFRIPWLIYHPKLQSYSADVIQSLETDFLADEAKTWPLHDKFGSDNKSFHQAWAELRILTHEQWVFIGDCRRDMQFFRLSASLTSQGIEIRDVLFHKIPIAFPALMKYLRYKGGKNIQYAIRQRG